MLAAIQLWLCLFLSLCVFFVLNEQNALIVCFCLLLFFFFSFIYFILAVQLLFFYVVKIFVTFSRANFVCTVSKKHRTCLVVYLLICSHSFFMWIRYLLLEKDRIMGLPLNKYVICRMLTTSFDIKHGSSQFYYNNIYITACTSHTHLILIFYIFCSKSLQNCPNKYSIFFSHFFFSHYFFLLPF